ncbi:MAG: hypothetical protein R2932_42465 [Caldilineaceae bacterium]
MVGTTYHTDGSQTYSTQSGPNLMLTAGTPTTVTLSADQFVVGNSTTLQLSDGTDLTINSGGGGIFIGVASVFTSDERVTLDTAGGVHDLERLAVAMSCSQSSY